MVRSYKQETQIDLRPLISNFIIRCSSVTYEEISLYAVGYFVSQVWFQNRRAKWRKTSERLQRSFSEHVNSPRPERSDTTEIGLWLAEKSLVSLLAARRASMSSCDNSVNKQSGDLCRLSLNLGLNYHSERDKLGFAEDFNNLQRQCSQLYVPLLSPNYNSWHITSQTHSHSDTSRHFATLCILHCFL